MRVTLKYLVLTASLIFPGCQEDVSYSSYPRLTTLPVTNISESGATFNAKIEYEGKLNFYNYGFLWSDTSNFNLQNSLFEVDSSEIKTKTFSKKISKGLFNNTSYFVKAFLETPDFIVYGNPVEFKSQGSSALDIRIKPLQGTIGDTISIFGNDLPLVRNDIEILFDEVPSEIIELSSDTIRVIIPRGIINDPKVSVQKEISVNLDNRWSLIKIGEFHLNYHGIWTYLGCFPGFERENPVAFSVDGKGYFGLGAKDNVYFNDLWEYSIETDSWLEIQCPFVGRSQVKTIAYGEKAYFFGGVAFSEKSNSQYNFTHLPDVWEYNPQNFEWKKRNDFPGNGRTFLFAFELGGYAYLGGAFFRDENGLNTEIDFWRYDILNDNWQQLDNFEQSILSSNAVGASNGNKGYVLGLGKELWSYNQSTQKWESLSVLPTRYTYENTSIFNIGDEIFFAREQNLEFNYTNTNLIYEFESNSVWKEYSLQTTSPLKTVESFAIDMEGYLIYKKGDVDTLKVMKFDPYALE
ncbi:MAG: IPT/TIG domain-containing protein [Cyclobacteriaceae bacterium]